MTNPMTAVEALQVYCGGFADQGGEESQGRANPSR